MELHPTLSLEALSDLATKFAGELKRPVADFELGGTLFKFSSATYLMGVINLSADSWYRESVCLNTEAAVQRGVRLMAEGAHLIDLGAESSVLTAAQVDSDTQIKKLVPVI